MSQSGCKGGRPSHRIGGVNCDFPQEPGVGPIAAQGNCPFCFAAQTGAPDNREEERSKLYANICHTRGRSQPFVQINSPIKLNYLN